MKRHNHAGQGAMELNQIRYFVVLAKELHFTRASERCNVSQPSLTKAIQKLEDELGGALFVRDRARTQLTELGHAMVPALSRAMHAATEARQQAAAFRRRVSSPLRVGLELSIPAAVLASVLGELQRQCAELELSICQADHHTISERMLAGELDAGLLLEGDGLCERLHRWPLFTEGFVIVCPPDHRLQSAAPVTIESLGQETLLLLDNTACPIRRLVDATLARCQVKPRRQILLSSQEQILDMVAASVGVTVTGACVPPSGPVSRLPITLGVQQRSLVLATAAGRVLGPTPALFVKLMRARSWRAADLSSGRCAA
jgi:DNA-binding transcriptional LysR family regulator